jgi:hypothetical protein
VKPERFAIVPARRDACAFLTAVLECKETVVREEGGILVSVNGENAALMFGSMVLGQGSNG